MFSKTIKTNNMQATLLAFLPFSFCWTQGIQTVLGAGMAEQVKRLPHGTDDVISSPGSHMREREN